MQSLFTRSTFAFALVLVASSAQADTWKAYMSCDSGAVRIEQSRQSGLIRLSVNDAGQIADLIRQGMVRSEDLNVHGDFEIYQPGMIYGNWQFQFALPRDAGAVIYTVDLAYQDKALKLSTAYTNEDARTYFRNGAPKLETFGRPAAFSNCAY